MAEDDKQRIPPKGAMLLLKILPGTQKSKDAMVGDLLEEYEHYRRSDAWFWWQALNSARPIFYQ